MLFNRRGVRALVTGFCAGTLLLALLPANSVAADAHAFDPVLSLTGNCAVSPELDPVPDPGLCPGTPGIDHPEAPFSNPRVVATDSYGDIYVGVGSGEAGRIDVFGPTGEFITEVPDKLNPGALAIDSDGNLYVGNNASSGEEPEDYVRFEPSEYKPAEGKIKYEKPSQLVASCGCTGGGASLDIDRSLVPGTADRLFVMLNSVHLGVYKPATEANEPIEEIFIPEGSGSLSSFVVDSAQGRIYLSDRIHFGPGITETEPAIQVIELDPPHALLFQVKGTAVPAGKFNVLRSVAADEGSGHFFAYDGPAKKVYEFDEDGNYLSTIEHGFQDVFAARIGVDNGINSPNGALNPTERYLFVPSHPSGVGHSFAFGPPNEGPPKIESTSFANVGEAEAELRASIEPFGLKTHYTFQYLTQQQFEEGGETFSGVPAAGEGDIPAGSTPIDVAAVIESLAPGTRYRFRVFAENIKGTDEAEAEFATYLPAEAIPPCPNDPLRSGFSGLLPDCRAYELVTPANTNGHPILALPRTTGDLSFPTRATSPAGGAVSFLVEGGAIPGFEGTSGLNGDPYLATRGAEGWQTAAAGPNGEEAFSIQPGSVSPDQGYSFWGANGGSKVSAPGQNNFLRYPNGASEPIGRGSLGEDLNAEGLLISENGGHVIFSSSQQLEEGAPPAGTQGLYDRTADEVTHVVSLLPGDETPAAGKTAFYIGASLDGKGIVFRIANTLYLRYNDEETYELGEGLTFEGIAEGGNRAFYLQGGKLWRFDAPSEERTEFSSGAVTPVNVAADGSTAYFVSQSVLTGEPNPNGAVAKGGQENLYRSEEGAISFLGTVTKRDVEGENLNFPFDGLGVWAYAVQNGRPATEASRTTPNGNTLLFQSRADLAGYDPQGHSEIYRYDFAANELDCLSCNPTLAPATSDADLQSISQGWGQDNLPVQSFGDTRNLSPDGRRAFFQSDEALVPSDLDGLQDVYEWETQGTGGCTRPGGCLYLISSGASPGANYLYAASESGNDVFIFTPDLLLPVQDPDETPSIYDARVEGGFPAAVVDGGECLGEACQPAAVPPPRSPLASSVFEGAGNVVPKRKKKGCRKAAAKHRCAGHRKHRRHHRHHKPATKGRAAR
jgi:hypothetical protein